jgi:hypothetical protein
VVRQDSAGRWPWVYYDSESTTLALNAGSYPTQVECLMAAEAMRLCVGDPVTILAASPA